MTTNKNLHHFLGLALTLLFLLSSCSNKEEKAAEAEAQNQAKTRPENVEMVAAIAKVEPANGFVELASEVSGIVTEMNKQEGDSVKQGELILKLDKETETLEITSARQNISAQQARVAASQADIREIEASLKEKTTDLEVTERLAATGADTRQNVGLKRKEKAVLQANLQAAQAQLKAAQSELAAFKTKLTQTEVTAQNRLVTAKEAGILINLEAKPGTAITAYQPFATLAPHGELVLHGEIDEMFASRVKMGQAVDVNYIGSAEKIATGKIIYLSPILESKSLFYENTGETTDRRVRLFKASLNAPEPLLINAKVECKIKLR